MIYQVAPIVTTAILQSLIAGGICYAVLSALLIVMKKFSPVIKYHTGNIALLVSFISFIQPLSKIPDVTDTAPVHSTTTAPVAYEKTTDVAPYVVQKTAALPEPSHTPGQVWQQAYDAITANSDMIMLLYLAGLLIFSARLLLQYLQSRRLKTRGTLPADSQWQLLLAKTKEQLNIGAEIAIAFTTQKISPCIIGHAKAVILIPVAIANNLSTEQAESILLHELAHYKQYDYYINLVTQCINCLMFFNPFVWLITRQCDKYRELSCDAIATKHDRSIELAETLAMIAGMHTVENRVSLSLKKRSPLLSRIQTLLNVQPSAKTSPRLLSFALVSIMLITGLILASSTSLFSSERDKQQEELQRISKEMFDAGNEKYIFVDAVLDSIIKLPSYAELLYMGPQYIGFETSHGPVELYGAQKEKYVEKLQRFLVSQGESKYTTLNLKIWRDKQVVVPDDLYSKKFQAVVLKDKFDARITSRGWTTFFNRMKEDGLLKNIHDDYEVEYGPWGIILNSLALDGEMGEKYNKLFTELFGVDLQNDKLSGRMNMKSLMRRQNEGGSAFEYGTTPNNEELAAISQKLFNEGQIEYLVADALKDGYIKEGEQFTIIFEDSMVRIARRTYSKQDAEAYGKKYRKYRKYYGCMYCNGFYSGTVKYSDIMNPRSDFRTGSFLFKEQYKKQSENLERVIAEMHKDRVLDTNYRYTVDYYSAAEIVVNTYPLNSTQADKYATMLLKGNPAYYRNNDGTLFIERNSNKPFPPGKTGNKIADELFMISMTMFSSGNSNYIIADAARDGLIKDGQPYEINYENGKVTIKGKTLTDAQQRQYSGRFKRFLSAYNKIDGPNGWSGTSLSIKDLRDPESHLRKGNDVVPLFVPGTNIDYTDYIVYQMHKDGLVDTAYEVRAEYSPRGIFANGEPLSGALAEKYKALFLQSDPTLRRGKKVSILWTPNKPKHDAQPATPAEKEGLKRIFIELQKDGLVDTNHKTEIVYNRTEGLTLNLGKLNKEHNDKYIRMFKKAKPDFASGRTLYFSHLWYPDKPYPRSYYDAMKLRRDSDALRILSERMFASGSQSFAVVDAIRDGYIKQDQPYEISYKAGKFSVKGQNIPADVRERYERKLERFRAIYGDSVNMWGTISSTLTGTVRDDEFEKQFGIMLPKPSKADKERVEKEREAYERNKEAYKKNKEHEEKLKAMVRVMHRDGLLDTAKYFRISYKTNGLYVNNQRLTGSGAEHYIAELKSMGYKPGMTHNGIIQESIRNESDVPKWARSTTSFDLHPELHRIADTMFKEGNPNFILAIALHEGVIKEGRNIGYSYKDGIVIIDGEKVAEPEQTIYAAKLKSFYKQHSPSFKYHVTRGQDVRIKTLCNPRSPIRQARVPELRQPGGSSYLRKVITMMAKDGLVDTTVKHTLKYNARGIFINGKKLTDEQAAKYEPILEKGFGHKPRWISGDQVSYESK